MPEFLMPVIKVAIVAPAIYPGEYRESRCDPARLGLEDDDLRAAWICRKPLNESADQSSIRCTWWLRNGALLLTRSDFTAFAKTSENGHSEYQLSTVRCQSHLLMAHQHPWKHFGQLYSVSIQTSNINSKHSPIVPEKEKEY
ncbi:hypothetical protein FQR65_LT19427 [Abscondita terminalis]|nr:hypothetical protein FQR65_LT19427 [Abscondita terminalis]